MTKYEIEQEIFDLLTNSNTDPDSEMLTECFERSWEYLCQRHKRQPNSTREVLTQMMHYADISRLCWEVLTQGIADRLQTPLYGAELKQ